MADLWCVVETVRFLSFYFGMKTISDLRNHYSLTLGLIPPWLVANVDLNVENRLVEIVVPWAGSNSRFTLLFERFAIDAMIAAKSIKAAANLLGLSLDQVHHIQTRAVDRGLSQRNLEEVKLVGIDEKSFLKDHRIFANYRIAILFYCGKLELHPL